LGSFVQRLIRATLTLGTPGAVFAGTHSNQLILTNLRMSVQISGTVSLPAQADIKIFGMLKADMDALTTAWLTDAVVTDNTVLIEVETDTGFSQIFFGYIFEACPQYDAMPNVYFQIQSQVNYVQQLAGAPASSYPQVTPVATICADLASRMGLTFNNQGVTATLAFPYLAGTLMDQLFKVCDSTNTDWFINAKELVIAPRNTGRMDLPVLEITPDNGLIGYPVFTRSGLYANVLYDPALGMQQRVKISGSDVPAANGTWSVLHYDHSIESVTPDGLWQSSLQMAQAAIQGDF
jgi:hypothetical protein